MNIEAHTTPTAIPCPACTGCSACEQACPAGCISMEYDTEGFLYPHINPETCLHCKLCERVCPVLHAEDKPKELHADSSAWGMIAQNHELFIQSGSGGAFSLMAKKVLEEGGVVIGAAWNSNWEVEHTVAYTWQEYCRIAGTKYVQSRLGNNLKLTAKLLKEKRTVLFGGTGCQITGLLSYLRNKHPNLITVNIACYGSPSPLVWKKYLADLAAHRGLGEIEEINFRRKDDRNALNLLVKGNKGSYQTFVYADPFAWGMVHDIINRPCCEDCLFKGAASNSDITIGDAWGLERFDTSVQAGKGVSLAIAHTPRGLALIHSLQSDCRYFRELPLPAAISTNKGIIPSHNSHKSRRSKFFTGFSQGASPYTLLQRQQNAFSYRCSIFVQKCIWKAIHLIKKALRIKV